MGSFCNQVTPSHGDGHFVRTVHREISFWSIGLDQFVSWLMATEWNA